MTLRIQVGPRQSDAQLVAVAGRLDTHTYGELDAALAPILTSGVHSLVLDLADLVYISSAGVRSIFKARKALAGHGGKVLVARLQPQIQKVFDVVKAVPLEEIFTSVAEADAYLDAMQRKVMRGDDADA
mgnify:CR=1 FL=1